MKTLLLLLQLLVAILPVASYADPISGANTVTGAGTDCFPIYRPGQAANAKYKVCLNGIPPLARVYPLAPYASTVAEGTNLGRVTIPIAGTVYAVVGCVNTAPGTNGVTIDVNKLGTGTILSTKLTIDSGDRCGSNLASYASDTPAVISDTTAAAAAEYQYDVDDDDSDSPGGTPEGNSAAGLQVWIVVY